MFELIAKATVQLLGYTLPFILRWHFTPQRLASSVKIRLTSEGEGVDFLAGELPKIEAWIVITNQTPFALELDRCYGSFGFGQPICEFTNLERRKVTANGEELLVIRATMSVFQAEYVRKMQEKNHKASIDFHGQFSCKVNRFSVDKFIETKHFRLCNFHIPLSTWLPLAQEPKKTEELRS